MKIATLYHYSFPMNHFKNIKSDGEQLGEIYTHFIKKNLISNRG